MKKISLIIPIYNTEKYLRQCLESAINQTYQNIEIICVDDGSTDNSGRIADEFAKKDDRIIIIHQDNHGESYARNQGLKKATGDYIAFMDCDDWIEPDMYETLVRVLESNNVDIAVSSWYKDTEKNSQIVENQLPVTQGVMDQKQLMTYFYRRDEYRGFAYIWNKLYKREIIYCLNHHNPILFDEDLKIGGDVLYIAEILLQVSSAIYIDKAFYHYRQRQNSGCRTVNINTRFDWLRAYEIIIEKFKKEKIDEEILIWVKRFLVYHSSNVAEIAYNQENKVALEKCQEIMEKYHEEYVITNEKYPDRIARFNNIKSLVIG